MSKKRKIKNTLSPRSSRLELFRPEAREVFVVGSFNDWQMNATALKLSADGKWAIELLLPVGRYEYRFVADGEWLDDPIAKETVPNPYGGINAVLIVV